MSINHKLSELRNKFAISRAKLAKAIGVSYSQLYKYECGQDNISIDKLQKISEYLNIPITKFFDNQQKDGVECINLKTQDISYIREISNCFNKIKSDSIKDCILSFVKNISSK
jgi:transcriptional regulator with XRE-family HTH domain